MAAHLVLATVSSEIAEAAAETALTAVVDSAIVAEVAGLSRAFYGFSSTHELKILLFLGGGELGILIW